METSCLTNSDDPENPPALVDSPKKSCPQIGPWKVLVMVLILLGLVAVLTFVVFPIAVMVSVGLQRKLLFTVGNSRLEGKGDQSQGVYNFYITVSKPQNVILGAAYYSPLNSSEEEENIPFFNHPMTGETITFTAKNYPVLLYFHGNGENRFSNPEMYDKLRQFYQVVSFDYRSFADSSQAELTEEGLVADSVEVYKWLLQYFPSNNIYIWGKSLGSALATEMITKLPEEIHPAGLVLEAAFSSLREEVASFSYAKIFSWLPWFENTILDGLEKNFKFDTAKHILKVNCPIMLLHAQDDSVVPYTHSEKLFRISYSSNPNVIFHLLPSRLGCNHWWIYKVSNFEGFIRDHFKLCQDYKTRNSEIRLRKLSLSELVNKQ